MRFNFYKDPRENPVEQAQALNPDFPASLPPPPPRPGMSQVMSQVFAPEADKPQVMDEPPTYQNLEQQIQELLEGQENLRYELQQVRMQVSSNSQNLESLQRESYQQRPQQGQPTRPSSRGPPATREINVDGSPQPTQQQSMMRGIPGPAAGYQRSPPEQEDEEGDPTPPNQLGYSASSDSLRDTIKGRLGQAYSLFTNQ
jgi:TolA-binding protein